MWKRIGRWSLAAVSSVVFIAPAFNARADEQNQAAKNASQAGQSLENAGQNVGNAAEQTGHAAGNAAEGAWNSTKSAAHETGNAAEQAVHGKAGMNDDAITSQVKQNLSTAEPTATDINVETKNDVVTLSGSVTSESARKQAVQIARDTDGVKKVKDHIKVNPSK